MGQEQSIKLSNNNIKNQSNYFPQINLNKSLFEFLYVIGRGGFGKVWKVNLKKTQKCYALKEMSKLKIILRRSEKSIQSERELLSNLYHPFLVNMICAFQDYENLYLVMDLFKGGDLRYHIFINKKFTESQSKFFCANVILGLEYIHNKNIIHRDIKPENLVLDSNGYLAITDFGVATKNYKNNSSETSGTPGYMAPEVLCSLNHSFFVDFYAIGVMAFEFMNGHRPYLGRNRKEIKEAVLAKQIIVNKNNLDENGWSFESADFINRMLQRKVSKRLGYNGVNEIKNHIWFKNIDWTELLLKKVKSPFIPKEGDNFDKKFCESSDNFFEIDGETKDKFHIFMKRKEFRDLFWNYTYIREEEKQKVLKKYYIKNYSPNHFGKSYIKIIQGDKKYPLRINNNNNNNNNQIINNENKNSSNNIRQINFNTKQKNQFHPSRSSNSIFFSPKNNIGQVFHKKRASKNSIIIDKAPINDINNNIKNYQNYRNSVIIINPYYNQNINYFSNNNIFHEESLISKNINKNKSIQNKASIHNKTKSFDNYINYQDKNNNKNNDINNTIDNNNRKKEIKINLNNKMKNNKKNIISNLQPSYSLKSMRKNLKEINLNNSDDNNFEKPRMIYSPPHITSAKINLKAKNKNSLISPIEKINNENYDNSNLMKVFSTRNNNIRRGINYINDSNYENSKNIVINKDNYSTLDYTLDKANNNSNQISFFNCSSYKKKINNNFRNSAKELNPNICTNKNKNISTLNIHENNCNETNNNTNNLYSSLNKLLYQKNNETIPYSSTTSNKNIKKINFRPTCLYSNSQLLEDKIFNNPNIEDISSNRIKKQNSFKINNAINNTLNNSKSKDFLNIINTSNSHTNNKNNFNKRKNVKNTNERLNNLNYLKKNNNYNIHSKLWSTSESNTSKNNIFEQSFSNMAKNNKENLNNNFFVNINTNTINNKKNNITQIKVTLIPKHKLNNKNNNI